MQHKVRTPAGPGDKYKHPEKVFMLRQLSFQESNSKKNSNFNSKTLDYSGTGADTSDETKLAEEENSRDAEK